MLGIPVGTTDSPTPLSAKAEPTPTSDSTNHQILPGDESSQQASTKEGTEATSKSYPERRQPIYFKDNKM